jgi:hypothetical protein
MFWTDFWGLVNDTGSGMDAGTVTVRTAALGAHLSSTYAERLAQACMTYPGVASAAAVSVNAGALLPLEAHPAAPGPPAKPKDKKKDKPGGKGRGEPRGRSSSKGRSSNI